MNKPRSFTPVFDSRKRKLRNLWKRSDRYYARIKIAYPGEDQAKTRRVPLKAGGRQEPPATSAQGLMPRCSETCIKIVKALKDFKTLAFLE